MKNHPLVCHLGLLLLTFSVASCSIEKRRYQSGYHVQWFNAKHHVFPSAPAAASTASAQAPDPSDDTEQMSEALASVHESMPTSSSPVAAFKKKEVATPSSNSEHVSTNIHPEKEVTATDSTQKTQHPLARKAAIGGIIATSPALMVMNIGWVLLATFITPFLIMFCWTLLCGGLAIWTLVKGIQAKHAIENEPDKYTGLNDANAAITLGIIMLVMIPVVLLLGTMWYFSNFWTSPSL